MPGRKFFVLALLVALPLGASAAQPAANADGWITHPERPASPVVLVFRREITFGSVPTRLPVEVTADNRFILSVNGEVLGRGPSTGTIQRWRVSSVDLAPRLRRGRN